MKKKMACCQKCGVAGYSELLIYCRKCSTSAEHRYCLNEIPKVADEEVHWICEDCKLLYNGVRGKHEVKFCPQQDSTSEEIPRVHQDIPSPAKVVSNQAFQNGIISASQCNVNQDAEMLHSSQEHVDERKLKRRRKLILADEDELDEEFQPSSSPADLDERKLKRRRKLILADDDESDEEFQPSSSLDQQILRKTPEQAGEPPVAIVSSSEESGSDDFTKEKLIEETEQLEAHDSQVDLHCQQASHEDSHYLAAQPINRHTWRGFFKICNESYGPLRGHLSTKACERVCSAAERLPQVLHLQKLPRLDAWPDRFNKSPPTDESIALFFFPECERVESVFNQLLNDVTKKDYALKIVFEEAELYIYSSVLLPEDYHRFRGKYYPWGVFRRRQVSVPTMPASCSSKSSDLIGGTRTMEHSEHAVENEKVEGHVEEHKIAVQNDNDETSLCKSPCRSDKLSGNAQRMEEAEVHDAVSRASSLCPSKMKVFIEERERVEEESECREEREEGEVYDEYIDVFQNGDYGGADAPCLELFPLQVEDMAFTSRVQRSKEVDLKLGLGRAVSEDLGRCGDRSELHSHVISIL